MTNEKMKKPVKVEVTVDAAEFLEDLGGYEIFRRDICGYFLKHIGDRRDGAKLAWDEEESSSNPGAGLNKHCDALAAFHKKRPLPPGYYLIDEAFLLKAFVEGCKKYGAGWYEDSRTDASTYDRVFQLALFGEQKYA